MSAAQPIQKQELRGVLIPTGSLPVLLPNAAMTEVIDYRDAGAVEEGPPWQLGTVTWRQRPMPVVSIEQMLGQAFDPNVPRLRIAVCHGLSTDGSLPFIGIVSRGIPRLVRISESVISSDPLAPLDPEWPILARVNLRGTPALIPDLDRMAGLLAASA
jgi:chemosensory pili system protein ChpC